MHIVRYRDADGRTGIGVRRGDVVAPLPVESLAALLAAPLARIRELVDATDDHTALSAAELTYLPPVDGRTEVWAAGVTYLRSKQARVEESRQQDVYELVYGADRPELFFKAPAWRVVTDGEPVALRSDSALTVPEPELAVVVNAHAEIVGYLVCNDMSSRSIEGANPLYLPQAKIYAGACALSAGIRPAWQVNTADLAISMTVLRAGRPVFEGVTSTAQLRRSLPDLVSYLFLADNHPDGVVLSTGTGIVPDIDFGLAAGDVVALSIGDVGTLRNPVVVGRDHFAHLAAR